MNKEKGRVPKLRFPGFTEDWEQCKLGDLAEIVRGASPRPISDPKWFDNDSNVGWLRIADVTAQDGRIRYLEQKISELGQEKTRVIKTPHLLLSIAATVGKPVINYVPTGVHDGFLIFLNPKFNILYAFWWLEMFREKWNKYGQPGSQVNLNSDLVKNQVINIPNEKEQEKISSFLESLDKIITLHQRKLEHLNLKKKALLQKLFPKDGERYPELRFPGFTDAWEQCKLDDIAKIKTGGGTPKTAKPEYWSGNIPWIQSSDLVEGDITHVNINKFINNNALKNSAAKLISRDSIALVTRVGVGKVAVINQDFTTSQDFLSLSDFDRRDIKFLAYQLYRLMQENAKVLQGTSIKGITKTELIEQSILIPNSGQEQHLISNVLSKIDSIITLHQRKLEHLQLQKKALLQQMFV